MIRRAAILFFATLAAALATVVIIDVLVSGRLTLFEPTFLGGFAVIGIGLLLGDMIMSRDRARASNASSASRSSGGSSIRPNSPKPNGGASTATPPRAATSA